MIVIVLLQYYQSRQFVGGPGGKQFSGLNQDGAGKMADRLPLVATTQLNLKINKTKNLGSIH